MPDINRDVSIEQVDYTIDVNNIEYSIEINPQQTFELQLNEQGPQGLTGPQGETGATGNGINSIVKTGTSGLVDTYTIYYTDGNSTTFDVTNGTNGVDGQAATISVGSVSTGAAGTSASVVNSGTSSNAVLDFTIPRGDKGDTGDTGATGISVTGVSLISTVGLVKTYRMSFSDGSYFDYTVTDGASGSTTWGGITGILSNQTDLQNALDDKYDASNPNGFITSSALAPYALSADLSTVATSGSYNDLSNKPTIPDISNLANKDLSNLSSTGNAKFQAPLVSGTNIKTINNNSILGSGNLTLDGLPSQTGKAGKFLQTDGTDTSWESAPFRNIGEIVSSVLPLTDAGLHLLDGSLISGGGAYDDFVNYIANVYNTSTDKYSNVTKIGSIVDTDGVLSGFAIGVYATIKEVPYSTADSIEILLKTTTGTLDTSNFKCFYSPVASNFRGVDLQINPDNKIQLYVSSNAGSSWDIVNGVVGTTTLQSDTQYYFKYVYTGTNHILYMSTTGAFAGEETTEVDVTNSSKPSNSAVSLGLQAWSTEQNNFYWRGSIDLNESYININGERWWDGRQTSGFVTEDEWQQSVTDKGVCGKFVYDSVNNTVRLPKITGFIEGTTDVTALGDLVEAGLPNIEQSWTGLNGVNRNGRVVNGFCYDSSGDNGQVINPSNNNAYRRIYNYGFDASRSNPIYGRSTTVQPQTIKVLYYIVIATSTKTDIQVDIDQITTDLNGKADVDLTNVNNSGTSRGAGWAMPSDTYINLTLGASGTRYTAPANGWFMLATAYNGTHYITLDNQTSLVGCVTQQSAGTIKHSLPAKKGDIIYVEYNAATSSQFKFIYAQGSESEAQ